jgi:hypothetical protein
MTDNAGDPGQATETEATGTSDGKKPRRATARKADRNVAPDVEAKDKGRSRKSRPKSNGKSEESTPKARKPRGKRREDLNQALVFELRTLRASLAHVLESMELRLGGRITELLHGIEGDPGLDQKPRPLTVKAAQAAMAEIDALRIKPKRGRIKDIRRIDRTIRALRELQPKS